MANHTFVISDENNLNSYGFRVMTKGIDIKQYKRNPIVLWYHKRPAQWKSETNPQNEPLPIGKAIRLWKDEGKLYAEIEFDQNDEFAKKIEDKLEGGYLNMCSPGLTPIDISDDPKNLLQGQRRVTLMKSELEEISIADIGSNKNALRLYNQNKGFITLSDNDEIDNILPQVKKEDNSENTNNNKISVMKNKIALLLNMDPNASDDAIETALKAQLKLAKEASNYKAKMEAAEGKLKSQDEARIITLVAENIDVKFTADKKDHFEELGKKIGFDTLKLTFDNMTSIGTSEGLFPKGNNGKPAGGGDETLTFAKLKEQGLEAVENYKNDHRADYIKLYKDEYGQEPNLKN